MKHWLTPVITILMADTSDLRELALVAGGDPKTFYRGVDIRKLDFSNQNLAGMEFSLPTGRSGTLPWNLQRLQVMRDSAIRLIASDRLGRDVFARGEPETNRVVRTRKYRDTLYDLLSAYSQARSPTRKSSHKRGQGEHLRSLEPVRAFQRKEARTRLLGRYRPARGGHAPGHLREAFQLAVEEYEAWKTGTPEPTILVGSGEVPVPIRRVFGWLWNCTDIMPGQLFDRLDDHNGLLVRRTYAAGARHLLERIKGHFLV